jgi:23S rRNA U2552 (ribose-2'-O)-methylase RlmE/FtsJ
MMKNIFQIKIQNPLDSSNNNELEKEIKSINNTLQLLLVIEKKKIDKYLNIWDKYKKFTNEYEFIYSSQNDIKYKSLLNINKVSRSYFKLWEILNDFSLLPEEKSNKKIKIANIAEAPGGFIEAIVDYISFKKFQKPFFYGFSLLNCENKNIPNWKFKKNYLHQNNIFLNSFNQNKGNLYDYNDVNQYIKAISLNSCHLITCDGGFDINGQYESQEKLINKLLLCEIFIIFKLQKNNGNSIIKCFDLFSDKSILVIYLLSLFYSEIYIIKPTLSRPANSEKYLLCKNFNVNNLLVHSKLIDTLKNHLYFKKHFNIKIPSYFKLLITEYNIFYTNRQIFYISNTIKLIEDILENKTDEDIKLKQLYDLNKPICEKWCDKYQFAY